MQNSKIKKKIITLIGPTACNKTSNAVHLIKKFPKLDHLLKKPEAIIHMDFEQLQKIVNKTLTEVRDTGEEDKTGNTIISITAECHIEITSGISNDIELAMVIAAGNKTLTYPYGNVYKYVTTIEQLDANQTYFNTAQTN